MRCTLNGMHQQKAHLTCVTSRPRVRPEGPSEANTAPLASCAGRQRSPGECSEARNEERAACWASPPDCFKLRRPRGRSAIRWEATPAKAHPPRRGRRTPPEDSKNSRILFGCLPPRKLNPNAWGPQTLAPGWLLRMAKFREAQWVAPHACSGASPSLAVSHQWHACAAR